MAAKSIDAYLANVEPDKRAALETLRGQIRAAVPEAEECISYGIPAFRLKKIVCGFAAMKKHCGFYVFDDRGLDAFRDALRDFDTSKGTVRFQPERPMPAALVKKIVRAKVARMTEG